MSTIISTDIIFARIMMGCRELFSFRISGISSAVELMSHVKTLLVDNGQSGNTLLTLDLRNQTQGWTARRAIVAWFVPGRNQPGTSHQPPATGQRKNTAKINAKIKLKIPNRSAKLWVENYSFSSLLLEGGCLSGGGGLNRPQERSRRQQAIQKKRPKSP